MSSPSGSPIGRPSPPLPQRQAPPGPAAAALSHPLRVALLDLLRQRGTLTATEAARELGESSGACSFHLRQLARYGQVEEVPGRQGRVRPWRLATSGPSAGPVPGDASGVIPGGRADEFGALARELENEGYRRWLAGRDDAPPGWHDEAFSAVLHLTPDELADLAGQIRAVIADFAGRAAASTRPGRSGPADDAVMPVGVVARMFPLLPADSDG